MPWSKRTLTLPASPRSVRRARDWVAEVLTEIGRPELIDSGRLGVSELVTNVLLHAEPPMTIRVRGTREHPRIEVWDRSLLPPHQRLETTRVDHQDPLTWATGGRGLNLVASHAVAWGADIDHGGEGKVVWFEPAAEPSSSGIEGAVFDLDQELAQLDLPVADPEDAIDIDLIGFPVELFIQFRQHFAEIGRELRLLALSSPGRYPAADEFAALILQVEHERRQVRGLEALARAHALGLETVDLHYVAPRTATTTMAKLDALLQEVYATFPDDALLTLRPGPELIALQRWYFGEFVRQNAGADPLPWERRLEPAGQQDVS